MDSSDLALVILAAGKGTRMRSRLPKVLHPVCGRPILLHTVALGRALGATRIVVIAGSGANAVREALADFSDVQVAVQEEQLGTAHAALQARSALRDWKGPVLVMNGDHPLYRPESFEPLLAAWRDKRPELALLSTVMDDPTGYGRVVLGADGTPERVVEQRDADEPTLAIREINLGAYLALGPVLFDALAKIGNDNAQAEYYLTDLLEVVLADGGRAEVARVPDPIDTMGINDRAQLAEAEAILRRRINAHWMRAGVTLTDPSSTWIDVDVEIGEDTVLAPGVALRGRSRIGSGVRIDAHSVVDDSEIGDDCWIKPQCWLESSRVSERCVIGPSAHLRPDVELAEDCRIGNFVEVKNSRLGVGSKADHLSYLGDADVGSGVTIGCGAITVNYDGQNKNRTTIGNGAFVGCNSNLIAPVTVADDAYVAAGSTLTQGVPEGALAVARARQRNIEGWRERRFGEKKPRE